MKRTLLLLSTGLFLLASCKPPEPPKITATDTSKSGPGGQTIKGGDVTMSFSADGKPLTFTRGNGSNLINTQNPGKGFYMTSVIPPGQKDAFSKSSWLWHPSEDGATNASAGTKYFKKVFQADPASIEAAKLLIAADNSFVVWVNGKEVAKGSDWKPLQEVSITPHLKSGENVLAIAVTNPEASPSGLVAALMLDAKDGKQQLIPTDASWLVGTTEVEGWRENGATPEGWQPARVLGAVSMNPWRLSAGSGLDEKIIPFTSLESQDGKLILTAADNTRTTLAVNAGNSHISFRFEKMENVPTDSEPILRLQANFNNICPMSVPLDYMVEPGNFYLPRRVTLNAAWPFLWFRGDKDPLGAFAFFVPLNDDDHNETLLRIWTEEKIPHPKINGKWTYERAKAWVEEWKSKFTNTHTLSLSAEKPEDLDVLFDYAKKVHVNRLYLHTDTWRGAYWVYDRDPLSVNTKVFPRGEADLKAFQDKLKANGMDAMLHTLSYGFGPDGSKYIGKGKKTDHRISNWGKGKLEKPISETDKTILFRPNTGVKFPNQSASLPWPQSYQRFFSLGEILIDDEIIPCKFEDTDKEVWKLTVHQRGVTPAKHEAGTEVIGLLKAYNQNYYPDSRTDLPEIAAKEYADFFNRMGLQHNEFDGGECHEDVPWGFRKFTMFVYQNTDHPMTSNTSGGTPNPWDMVYRFKTNGDLILNKRGGGYAALTLHREGRLSTSPIENHVALAGGAAANSTGFAIKKPEPMFGIFPKTIVGHGLADLIADQFSIWRELAPKLTPELRKQISESYYQDKTYAPLDPGPALAKTLFEARKTQGGYEIQPFCVMVRGKEDVEWKGVMEYGAVGPRQYIGSGLRLRLENPFGRQAPQFIIRVLDGYTDGFAKHAEEAPKEELNKDMQGYLIGAGASPDHIAATPAATPAPTPASTAPTLMMQPKAAQIKDLGKYVFADVGPALEMSFDNTPKAEPAQPSAAPNAKPQATPAPVEHFQGEHFPSFAFKGNSQNARGVALTVTGDGSGAFLIVQVGSGGKDYVVPIDFTGRKDIFIPLGEVARTTGRWGIRYHARGAGYGQFGAVSMGFCRIPANTKAKVLVENLRLVGNTPSSIKNPVIHAGAGTLSIKGEVKTDQYLWYQGGDKVGVYDLDWHLQANLPVELKDYEIDHGFNELWIDGEASNPAPWFDVQFITKGESVPLKN